jgi:GT2 family glycosyltransferase
VIQADLITVYHNDTNYQQHRELLAMLEKHERNYRMFAVDNREKNRGFAAACNLAAFHPEASAPVIGFLNPDVQIHGPFLAKVRSVLQDHVVITGCRFGKPDRDLAWWGVKDWVCGAALFVNRRWFTSVTGFDLQFVWSHEETDLIRRAEAEDLVCHSVRLPITHTSPASDSPEDTAYKHRQFVQAQKRYYRKWGSPDAVQLR